MSDQEATNFRAYLLKGGFLIVDDFRARDWPFFEEQMRHILPDVRFFDLDATHPIFHSFFEIDAPDEYPNFYDPGKPIYRGVYENNDPTKRLMAIINYNTDISEYWEFSGTGLKPIDESNDAYKLGVNYVVYGMTHRRKYQVESAKCKVSLEVGGFLNSTSPFHFVLTLNFVLCTLYFF